MKKLIFISSSSRTHGTISNFESVLPPYLLDYNDQSEYAQLTLVNFSSRMSYYNISLSRGNSQFIYNEGNGNQTITLPDGNYSVKDLANQLTTQLNAVSTVVFTISINLNTMKFYYTYEGVPTSNIVFTNIKNAFDILGFNNESKTFITNSLVSDKIVSIGNLDALFIHCNFMNGKNKVIEGNNLNFDSVFAKVNIVSSSFFGTIYYDQSDYKYTSRVPSSTSNVIGFSIRDRKGNLIEFQDDYDMVLEIETFPKRTITNEHLSELMIAQLLK